MTRIYFFTEMFYVANGKITFSIFFYIFTLQMCMNVSVVIYSRCSTIDKFKLPWVWPRTKNIHISSSCDLSEVIDQNHCDHQSVTLCRVSRNCKWNSRSVNEDTPCIVKWDINGLANLHNTTKGCFPFTYLFTNKPSNNLLCFFFLS